MRFLLPLVCVAFAAVAASSETLTFQGQDAWATWQAPFGLTEVGENGQLQLVKFRKDINAVADAHRFSYESKSRGRTTGGIWEAVSNPADADNIIDGDLQTFWRPDPADAVEDWAIEIDLGRAVLAREIRLTFPDEEGARPFRQFTVYGSTGTRISVQDDMVMLEPLFRTTRPNAASEIVIPLGFTARDTVLQLDEGLGIDPVTKNNYRVIQRIRIEAEEKTPDAALAEIEVRGIGDNISIGTMQRGRFVNGINSVDPQNLFDADMNTNNLIGSSYGSLGWKDGGGVVWSGFGGGGSLSMNSFSIPSDPTRAWWAFRSVAPARVIRCSIQTATRSLSSNLPVPDAFDYTELLTHINPNADRLLYIRYMFKPRKMRYFFWHGIKDTGWGIVKWAEFMLFSPGYPAEVVLHSDFIDLGQTSGDGRPKVIKSLSWDAELAAGTRLQLRSRSGNSLEPVYTFYNKIGELVH